MGRRGLWFLLGLAVFLAAAGCSRREEPQAGGSVKASEAYTRHFGSAPTIKDGSCFAMVGYLPLKENPLQVRPVPLFLFSRDNQMEKVVRHLLALDRNAIGRVMENPFPQGTELKSLNLTDGSAIVHLSFGGRSPQDPRIVQGIVSSLGHTLLQFPGVRRVIVQADGTPLAGAGTAGFSPDRRNILEPELPRPIGAFGIWEGGTASSPEEVFVAFDRPVSVQRVEVLADGKPLTGNYYQSAFDMAVVIHPGRGETVREGMPIRVSWQVSDRLGRSSSGTAEFQLMRQNRP